ncbi:MAG: hypothetical protein JWQ68_2536 [Cryobacterium sp.]|nr:hypothetical protein [Cryobacterium sp.]
MEPLAQLSVTLVAPSDAPTIVLVRADRYGQPPAVLVNPVDPVGRVISGIWVGDDDSAAPAGRMPSYQLMKVRDDLRSSSGSRPVPE